MEKLLEGQRMTYELFGGANTGAVPPPPGWPPHMTAQGHHHPVAAAQPPPPPGSGIQGLGGHANSGSVVGLPNGPFFSNFGHINPLYAAVPAAAMVVDGSSGQANGLGGVVAEPPQVAPPKETHGHGRLTWLSPKAGLITTAQNRTISFQLKDFCDSALTDLTQVLRPGFTLSYTAILGETGDFLASMVTPLHGQDAEKVFGDSKREIDLEDPTLAKEQPPPKDAYLSRLEAQAIPLLLSIFQRHSLPSIQLSSLHSQLSSCGSEELVRYVGSSSLKRRQFIERRTHLFRLASDDTVSLQPSYVHQTVCALATRLLQRGGCTSMASLYDFFCQCQDIPYQIRHKPDGEYANHLSNNWRQSPHYEQFAVILRAHPWIFAVFPNNQYVSVRRNIPHIDFTAFMGLFQNYGDESALMGGGAVVAGRGNGVVQSAGSYGAAGSRLMGRSMSQGPIMAGPGAMEQRPSLLGGPPVVHHQQHHAMNVMHPGMVAMNGSNGALRSAGATTATGGGSVWDPLPGDFQPRKMMVSMATQTDDEPCFCRCHSSANGLVGPMSGMGAGLIRAGSPSAASSASSPLHQQAAFSMDMGGQSQPRYYDPFASSFDFRTNFGALNIS